MCEGSACYRMPALCRHPQADSRPWPQTRNTHPHGDDLVLCLVLLLVDLQACMSRTGGNHRSETAPAFDASCHEAAACASTPGSAAHVRPSHTERLLSCSPFPQPASPQSTDVHPGVPAAHPYQQPARHASDLPFGAPTASHPHQHPASPISSAARSTSSPCAFSATTS